MTPSPPGRRRCRRYILAFALPTMVALLCSAPARARQPTASEPAPTDDGPSADEVAKASRLYEDGTAAHAAGRFSEAARLFAEADELAPDAAALEAALLAVLETQDAVLASRLAIRTAREPFNESLTALSERVRGRFADRVGRVVVHCDGCEAAVDGETIAPGVATVIEVGRHEVTIGVGGRTERRPITVEPSSIVTLLPVAPTSATHAPTPSPAPKALEPDRPTSRSGPSPAWFWVGFGLTAAAAGGTIASAVDTANKHTDFEAEPSQDLADAGEASQLRTNALIGTTAGLALITGVVGLFVVDWDGEAGSPVSSRRPPLWVSVGPTGAVLGGTLPPVE